MAETIQALEAGVLAFCTGDTAIHLTGSDAETWLQGQVTQDLTALESGPQSGCLCLPTGQLVTTIRVARHLQGLIISTPGPQSLLQRVDEFVVMEDVAARILGSVYSAQGATAQGLFYHDRTGYGGFDCLEPPDADELQIEHLDVLEIAAGIPRLGVDTSSKTLPPELGPAFDASHISYEKGCYVGQEVLQRIHSRGHTNRKWVGLVLEELISIGEMSGVGTVHRIAMHPEFGIIASATLRNEYATQGLQLDWLGTPVTVRDLPLIRNL